MAKFLVSSCVRGDDPYAAAARLGFLSDDAGRERQEKSLSTAMKIAKVVLVTLSILLAAAGVGRGAEFHVSPAGSAGGDGSPGRPWDLATAFAPPAGVQAGDTILLHGGTYRGGVTSKLAGAPGRPIVVRPAAGERVVFDTHPRDDADSGAIVLLGSDTIYEGFEVTCSHPTRRTDVAGSHPPDIRRGTIDVRGDRIALRNLVVHDLAQGISFWSSGEGGEISGCIIYHNGWAGPDRPHGHGIYTQNARGTKRIVGNIIFHNFGYGIHAYGSERASLVGFEIERNIIFDNGGLVNPAERAPGILVGGGSPVVRTRVRDNVVAGGRVRLGYPSRATNEDIEFTGNHCDGLVLRDFRKAIVRNNAVVADSNAVTLEARETLMLEGLDFGENAYVITDGRWGECAIAEGSKSRGMPFDEWRKITGLDATSRLTRGPAKEMRVFLHAVDEGRAHLAIVNPESLDAAAVNLSPVASKGRKFRIVSVKDLRGAPVAAGVFDGRPVAVPMRAVAAPRIVGYDTTPPPAEPRFGAFVVFFD
jgi:hypothetical protein